jgi:DNA topoisomerase-1
MEPLWDLLEKVGIEAREEADDDDAVLQTAKADAADVEAEPSPRKAPAKKAAAKKPAAKKPAAKKAKK